MDDVKNIQQKPSKIKKILKLILIVLLCVIWFVLCGFFLEEIWKEQKCECIYSSIKNWECPEYVCFEKRYERKIKKCKTRCVIYGGPSYGHCISECVDGFATIKSRLN